MTPPAAVPAHALPRVRRAPVRHPRRVSGPAAPAVRRPAAPAVGRPARSRRARPQPASGIALRAIGALDSASRSAPIERLVRGRVWIGALAFALIGIVAMQLFVFKLNNEIGRTLARAAALQRENAQIGIEGSESSSGSLVEPQAAAAGMTFAAPGSLRFLKDDRAAIRQAAGALSTPVQASTEQAAAPAATASSEAASSTTSSEAVEGTPGG